jgi:hypothetical protein
MALALTLTILATGCGSGEGRNDLPGTQVADLDEKLQRLERQTRFPVYYLGDSFEGFALSHIEYNRQPRPSASLIYGTCEVPAFADGGCAPPVEVQVHRACGPSRPDIRSARQRSKIRGVPTRFLGGGLAVYTGNVTITIFGRSKRRAAQTLRPIGADGPPRRLPAPTRAALEGTLTCGK